MACADVGNSNDCLNRDSLRGEELTGADLCQMIADMIVGKADLAANGVKVVEMAAGKRRRGRPPRNQGKVYSSSAPPPQRENQDEEDVCFICFDGGSLVLCDRRGCPKAYHPACIKRDEAFFKSKAKWNCGWHICSTCQKASHYMCYTCTYSLCKNCTKDADYVNVRGNKGFCALCRGTIMMIESTALGTKEMVQVDFDDQTSWEYLFKMYWILLKEKLSLSLSELIKAKNPWKEIAKGASTERSFGDLGASYSKRRKTMIQQKFLNKVEPLEAKNSVVMMGTPLLEDKNCASEKGHTKEYSLFLSMKEKEPASPLKGGDVLSDIGSKESSITLHSTETELSVNNIETDKIWHYQDPFGKIHGPFPMSMLRRWSMSGLFPPDLRIWRTNERKEDSSLLTDVLAGQYSQPQQFFHKICLPTKDVSFTPNDGYQDRVGDVRESWDLNVDQMESKQVEGSLNSMQNDANGHCCSNIESTTSKKLGSQSSCTAPLDIITSHAVQSGSPLPHGDSVKGDNYFSSQPPENSSLQSSTFSGKPCETLSHLVITGHGVEKWDCGSINLNENSNKTSKGQIPDENVKQDGTVGKSDKSCGQSWRSPLGNVSSGWDPNCGLISLAMALEAAEHNHDIDFPDFPTSTSKLNLEDSKPQSTKNKQPISSSALHQDSGPSWSTASSLVGNGSLLSEVAGEWSGYSSNPAKPFVEKWDSDLAPKSLKRTSLGSDRAATPSSGSGQLAHSSLTDPAENASGWDPIIPDPDEYSFGDESVSDLLAEVEAMESLNGLTSPTSNLRCGGELAQGAEPDCFSPACDPGKGDVLSSTNDLRMSSQSTMTIETIGASESEVIDAQKRSGRNSSTSAEMDEDKWPSEVSVNQYEAGSDMQLPAPAVTTWGMATIDTTWRAGRETMATNWEAIEGNLFFNLGGSSQGARNFSWGTGQGTFQDNGNINVGTYWGNQQEGHDFQARDSSFTRGGSSMHRHSTYNVPPQNGVGSLRPPPKGQRVCKFYERGDCKKGASCSYWHPR